MDVQQGGERRSQVSPDVIARARHDRAAFGEIYDHYLPRVYAFCRLHSASREEAQDLTAHSFERALDAIHGGLEGGSPRRATARGGGHLTTYTGGRRWHPSPDTGRIHSLLSRRWCPVSHSDLSVHGWCPHPGCEQGLVQLGAERSEVRGKRKAGHSGVMRKREVTR